MTLLDQDATDLCLALSSGTLSAVALMHATYDRIEAANPVLNALVDVLTRHDAVKLAQAADNAADKSGALHGLPMAIKDLAHAKGFRTSMGSPLLANQPASNKDDLMVARIRQAGALIIGKTNTPEFGLGSHTYNPVHGTTVNPWNPQLSTGGSSGGAAAALASGMVPLADGSDMMGSLRNPPGWTNTYGLRPTWGLVPSEPEGDSFLHQLATMGPMARSPSDLALLLSVQAGPDPRQPHGLGTFSPTLEVCELSDMRVGWLGDWGGALPFEDGVLQTCEAALGLGQSHGLTVEPLNAPFDRDRLWSSWITLRQWQIAGSLYGAYAQANIRPQLKPEAQWEVANGLKLTALDVHKASVIRSQWFKAALDLLQRFDVLAMPTAQVWPFDADLAWPKSINGVEMDTYHRWMEVVVPASLIGLPTLAVPAGFGANNGLPMGLQFIAKRGEDAKLLALGQAWHKCMPWVHQKPPMQ